MLMINIAIVVAVQPRFPSPLEEGTRCRRVGPRISGILGSCQWTVRKTPVSRAEPPPPPLLWRHPCAFSLLGSWSLSIPSVQAPKGGRSYHPLVHLFSEQGSHPQGAGFLSWSIHNHIVWFDLSYGSSCRPYTAISEENGSSNFKWGRVMV